MWEHSRVGNTVTKLTVIQLLLASNTIDKGRSQRNIIVTKSRNLHCNNAPKYVQLYIAQSTLQTSLQELSNGSGSLQMGAYDALLQSSRKKGNSVFTRNITNGAGYVYKSGRL